VCCSVLQCVAVKERYPSTHLLVFTACCSVLQCVAVCCIVLQCVVVKERYPSTHLFVFTACCSALQCVVVCCSVLQCVVVKERYPSTHLLVFTACCSVTQCVAVCCIVLQCVAVKERYPSTHLLVFTACCSVLQCVTVCCIVLQCVAVKERYPSTHLLVFTTSSCIGGRKRIKHHHLCHMTHSHLWTLSKTKVRLILQKFNQNPKKSPYVFGVFLFGEQRDQTPPVSHDSFTFMSAIYDNQTPPVSHIIHICGRCTLQRCHLNLKNYPKPQKSSLYMYLGLSFCRKGINHHLCHMTFSHL